MRAGHQAGREKCGRYMRFVKNSGSTSTNVDIDSAELNRARRETGSPPEKGRKRENRKRLKRAYARAISTLRYNRQDPERESLIESHAAAAIDHGRVLSSILRFYYCVLYLEILASALVGWL